MITGGGIYDGMADTVFGYGVCSRPGTGVLSDYAEFAYKCTDFYHPDDEGGLAWNDPEIGVEWPELTGEYNGTASNEGYALADGTPLNLSEKDKLWLGIKDTLAF